MKIIFSHWETAHKCMTFPRCLASGDRQQSAVTLSMCTTSTNCVGIWRGGLCSIYQQGTLRSVANNPVCSQGEWWWEADFLRRRLIPGGLQHLKREVVSDTHMEADLQFCELCLQGEQQWEHWKVQGACDNSMCQGYVTFFECQGQEISFKIMRPCHQCSTPPVRSD